MINKYFFIIFILITHQVSFGKEYITPNLDIKRKHVYKYTYIEKDHSLKEDVFNVGLIYGISWIIYPISQPEYFKKGSWKTYKNNFGHFYFDKDGPFWNWFLHPVVGAQFFLYYRANGYSQENSLLMSFISSTLFELTIEIYTEPSSIQDLYQTPVLGSVLGLALEKLSMYFLNTGNFFGEVIGHILNPMTLFWFYNGKIRIIPSYNGKKAGGLTLMAEF